MCLDISALAFSITRIRIFIWKIMREEFGKVPEKKTLDPSYLQVLNNYHEALFCTPLGVVFD